MSGSRQPMRLYGELSRQPDLDWAWVDRALRTAGTYWVTARSDGYPHPRPVWGVWLDAQLYLSIGSPVIRRQLAGDPRVTAHLAAPDPDSGDAVIVEGLAEVVPSAGPTVLEAYAGKYGRNYEMAEFGPLTRLEPSCVLAWRAAGWAGRDGFRETGKWDSPPGAGSCPAG